MTIHVTDSVIITRPVAQVFAFVADHQNLPAWTVGVKQSQRLTGIRRQVRADHRRLKTFLEQPGTQAASGSAD